MTLVALRISASQFELKLDLDSFMVVFRERERESGSRFLVYGFNGVSKALIRHVRRSSGSIESAAAPSSPAASTSASSPTATSSSSSLLATLFSVRIQADLLLVLPADRALLRPDLGRRRRCSSSTRSRPLPRGEWPPLSTRHGGVSAPSFGAIVCGSSASGSIMAWRGPSLSCRCSDPR